MARSLRRSILCLSTAGEVATTHRGRGRPEPDQKLSLAWTNWPLFTVGLVQRGYSDRDIQKILGGNVLRVAREVLGTSALRTDSSKTDAASTPPN